jgi:UDP-3-O-[3-hydroxymyristoyl] glucosamine N-acyltransferase
MSHTIAEIAAAIGAPAEGETDIAVLSVAEPASALADQLAMASTPAYAEALSQGAAQAAVLWAGADWQAYGLRAAILPRRPRFAMAGLTALMDRGQGFAPGIHPSAVIDASAQIGADVSIGPQAVIGPRARIGDGSVIGPLCHVGADAVLGAGAFLREHVSIGARVHIGARFIAQPGARVGGDGFSFVTPEASGVESVRETLGDPGETQAQSYARIHSLGSVRVGDDVEMGANATIDSGTIRDTIIGSGCKLDNLTQIGHNVILGRDCLVCAQAGVAGSTVVGNHVVFGGQTGVSDNLSIGDRVITGGGTIVLSNLPAGRVVLGYPATKMDSQIETYKALRRLPRLVRDVAALRKAVFKPDAND